MASSSKIVILGITHMGVYTNHSLSFVLEQTHLFGYTMIFLVLDISTICSLWQWQVVLKFCKILMLYFNLYKLLREERLNHIAPMYLILKVTLQLFSEVEVPFYIPNSNIWEIYFVHLT
jgi:hypothetical protein